MLHTSVDYIAVIDTILDEATASGPRQPTFIIEPTFTMKRPHFEHEHERFRTSVRRFLQAAVVRAAGLIALGYSPAG